MFAIWYPSVSRRNGAFAGFVSVGNLFRPLWLACKIAQACCGAAEDILAPHIDACTAPPANFTPSLP